MQSSATTVKDYLAELPEERRKAISKVRAVIRKNLPKGIVETMNWGMITYEIPLKTVPDTYNGKPLMYAGLASQKNHMAVYLSNVYADPEITEWFLDAYKATGKKLDMGKSCVRFKKLENLPLEVIGEAIAHTSLEDFVELYDNARR
ncbi:MAG: DUF1801 domain-containing protein [Acidimicrobiales bacterium]|nr:MAG: DUF1801 domain-containing protein [Acidimicrobiales bacterium]